MSYHPSHHHYDQLYANVSQSGGSPKRIYANCVNTSFHEAISAWFLGPQAENIDTLKALLAETADLQARYRLRYHPDDGPFITEPIRESRTFQESTRKLVDEFSKMTQLLYTYSIPFYSQRYAGHMSFETSLPGILGWVATLFCNPNNVAFEASPVTTIIELDVGKQMCEMLGYEGDRYWGHIACDGTVANLESIWAARNLKYYPLSLRDAMKPGKELEFIASTFKIAIPTKPEVEVLFSELDLWRLLNIPSETILDIPGRLHKEYGITSTYLDEVLNKYIIQSRGKQALETEWGMTYSPRYFVSATKHYSWPKSAAIAGLGADYMIDVPVDVNARVDVDRLRDMLEDCLGKKKPVFAVVGIIGSTEEGSVDPLDKILDLRDEYQKKGLCFLVHADAAWGGYFASMIRKKPVIPRKGPYNGEPHKPPREFVPSATLRKEVVDQLYALCRADSITIDPHKAGYIPYPAGGLCYRDGRLKSLLTWTAPYLAQSSEGESIGIYGVEGSKPGAPAIAAFLHHFVIGLHDEGHGALLGEATWSCRRIAAHWAAMSTDKDQFLVVPFNALSSEAKGKDAIAEQKRFIRNHILGKSNELVVKDQQAMDVLLGLGSDLNINAFACNFRIENKVNTDVEEANYLNNCIFKRLSITTPKVKPETVPMFLSSTTFKTEEYGECVKNFKARMGLETDSKEDLFVLRNVVMSPFQTAGDFVQTIADIFQTILKEEMQHVVQRNTIAPQKHKFLLQVIKAKPGKAFLAYRPHFHNANGRYQILLAVDFDMNNGSGATQFEVVTAENVKIDDICRDGASFKAGFENEAVVVNISNVKVIKKRPLDSRYREHKLPAGFVPFYLYGSDGNYFIDHVLLQAPNAQLTAPVQITFEKPLPPGALEKGLLLTVPRSEAAMQPVDAESIAWFKMGAQYQVNVYEDPNGPVAQGPGLFSAVGSSKPIASGKMTLGAPFVDLERLNTQDFTKEQRESHRMVSFSSQATHPQTKKEWREVVDSVFKL